MSHRFPPFGVDQNPVEETVLFTCDLPIYYTVVCEKPSTSSGCYSLWKMDYTPDAIAIKDDFLIFISQEILIQHSSEQRTP